MRACLVSMHQFVLLLNKYERKLFSCLGCSHLLWQDLTVVKAHQCTGNEPAQCLVKSMITKTQRPQCARSPNIQNKCSKLKEPKTNWERRLCSYNNSKLKNYTLQSMQSKFPAVANKLGQGLRQQLAAANSSITALHKAPDRMWPGMGQLPESF